jgi:hypothetical protein
LPETSETLAPLGGFLRASELEESKIENCCPCTGVDIRRWEAVRAAPSPGAGSAGASRVRRDAPGLARVCRPKLTGPQGGPKAELFPQESVAEGMVVERDGSKTLSAGEGRRAALPGQFRSAPPTCSNRRLSAKRLLRISRHSSVPRPHFQAKT